MSRSQEDVVAEAMDTLIQNGQLDVASYVQQYPELANDLQEILAAMVAVRETHELHRAALKTSAFARGLFSELRPNGSGVTVGAIVRNEMERSGLSWEEQAKQLGLPSGVLERLAEETTPATGIDNLSVKHLSDKIGTPFPSLLKVIRSLVSRYQSAGLVSSPQVAFTRSAEESSSDEKQTLLERVRGQHGSSQGPGNQEA